MLYADEAARQWQKREADWEKERIARDRLMQEVSKISSKEVRKLSCKEAILFDRS